MGPVEVVLDKKPPLAVTSSPTKGKGKGVGKSSGSASASSQLNLSSGSGSGPPKNDEKKVCLWPMGNGTTCGKTFTKFDSLKRHLQEAHKGKEQTCLSRSSSFKNISLPDRCETISMHHVRQNLREKRLPPATSQVSQCELHGESKQRWRRKHVRRAHDQDHQDATRRTKPADPGGPSATR